MNKCFSLGEKAFSESHQSSETRRAAGSEAPVPSVLCEVERGWGRRTHPGLQFSAERVGDEWAGD